MSVKATEITGKQKETENVWHHRIVTKVSVLWYILILSASSDQVPPLVTLDSGQTACSAWARHKQWSLTAWDVRCVYLLLWLMRKLSQFHLGPWWNTWLNYEIKLTQLTTLNIQIKHRHFSADKRKFPPWQWQWWLIPHPPPPLIRILDQSEPSIQVTWSAPTNQRTESSWGVRRLPTQR